MKRAAVKTKPAMPEDIVETIEVEQGSDAWFAMRIGVPTASKFKVMKAEGQNGEEAKTRQKLLYVMAGEIISGIPSDGYENEAMRRGRWMEPEALAHYEFTRGVTIERSGFVRRTVRLPLGDLVIGCSPDALVGHDGGVQVKTMRPELLIELVDRGRFPSEHKAQCQGEMWVTGRKWWDLLIYHDSLPAQSPTFRLQRDEAYIQQICNAVQVFRYDLDQLVKRIREKSR